MKKIGLWMYINDGGSIIQAKLKSKLEEFGYVVVNNFDLRSCFVFNDRVYTEQGVDLTSLDCLYHMNADEQSQHQLEILRTLEISGVKLINTFLSHEKARDKFITNFILRKNNIRVPNSALIPVQDNKIIKQIFEEYKTIILKPRNSHGGKGIQKFDNLESFMDFREFAKDHIANFYIEEYIDFIDHDYRIEVFNGKYIGSYARAKTHSFKTNISSGGIMTPYKVNQEQINMALKAVEVLGLTTTIVDFIKDRSGKDYILEVNPIMGIFVESGMRFSDKSSLRIPDVSYSNDEAKLNALVQYINNIIM